MKALRNWTIWASLSISSLLAQTAAPKTDNKEAVPFPTVVSAGAEGAVYVGDSVSGAVSQLFRGDLVWRTNLSKDPRAQVSALAQSPDGMLVATGSQKGGGFVARLKPTGEVVSTESLAVAPRTLAIDSAGAIYLGGDGFLVKRRVDFTIVSSIDPGGSVTSLAADSMGGVYAAIKTARGSVGKLAADGNGWLWQTDLGPCEPAALAVDRFGAVYVAGTTSSQAFITKDASQAKLNGVSDGFAARLLPSGELVWSTFVGGKGADGVRLIAFDVTDSVILSGFTASPDFPGGDSSLAAAGQQGFVAWLDAGGKVTRSMFPSRSGESRITGLAFDSEGAMTVAGTVEGDTPSAFFRRFETAPVRKSVTSLLKKHTVTVPTVTTQPTDQTTTVGGGVTFSMAAEFPTPVTVYDVIDGWQISMDNGITWVSQDALQTQQQGNGGCCTQPSTTVTYILTYGGVPASANGVLVRLSMNSGALITNTAKIIVSYTPTPTSVVLSGSNQSGLPNQSYGALKATVLDQGGKPLSGQQVTLTVTPGGSGASGTLAGGSPQTLAIGADGSISPGVLTANGTAGSFTIDGTIAGSTLTFSFQFSNVVAKYNFLHPAEPPQAANGTRLFKINNHGVAAGYYLDSAGIAHGITYDGSTYTNLTDITSYGTFPQGINDNGVIVGYYLDSSNVRHGFMLNGTTYTAPLDPPGSTQTTLTGINNSGVVSGYGSINSQVSGITYDGTNFTNISRYPYGVFDEYLSATFTTLNGISNNGILVGSARFRRPSESRGSSSQRRLGRWSTHSPSNV